MLAQLLTIFAVVKTGLCCSLYCPDGERICLDNFEGHLGADCTGLVGCLTGNQTCMGECPQENPVLSADGLSCSACSAAAGDSCPKCTTEQFWCRAESVCKKKTSQCSGKCPLLLYPVLTPDGECLPCSAGEKWCAQEHRCLDRYTEPCNGECDHWAKTFCNETSTCTDRDAPCGDQCKPHYIFCPVCQTCNHESEPCGGLRLCGDRCISDDRPCNAKCPAHLEYCMFFYSCLQANETCPCPPDTWGCCMYQAEDESQDEDDQQCQQQCNLADSDTNPTPYPCRMETYSGDLSSGECHPEFEKNCSGQCVPRN